MVGNICQVRPPENKISAFSWTGPEIQGGLQQLKQDISIFDPHLCVLAGGTALHAAKSNLPPRKPRRKNNEITDGGNWYPISDWRGSLFRCDIQESPFFGRKCIPIYHPAALLRVFGDSYITRFDLRRARKEGCFPELVLPERNLVTDVSYDGILMRLADIKRRKPKIGVDIEGWVWHVKCIALADSPNHGFVIPFTGGDAKSFWPIDQEVRILEALTDVLYDPTIPKVLQNGLYDRFVLAYAYGILIRGITDDTMLQHWEHQCEMEKSLAFQVSFYTREPFYKSGKWDKDLQGFWRYNCLDSALTLECNNVLTKTLTGSSVSHYNFNMELQDPFLYMELKGIRIDEMKKLELISELQKDADAQQKKVDGMFGFEVNWRSPKQVADLLYNKLGLPPKYKRGTDKLTTEYEAVLHLAKNAGKPELMEAIALKEILKRISDTESLRTDKDGRARFAYNVVGTDTGRVSCSTCPTGSGTNGQTITDENPIFRWESMRVGLRFLFTADEGMDMAQMDLAGADGWTVAAWCAKLGDPTMLEDLLAGLKIPKVIATIVKKGAAVNALPRPELQKLTDEIKKSDHLYFSCKQVQHGSNYGMKPPMVATRIFLESYGEINIANKEAELYQGAYFSRYKGIHKWHDFRRDELRKGFVISATGHKRIITGRRDTQDTLKAILSDEPQQNTTYATNLAALRLWKDPENRTTGGRLRIAPLHQIHDALLVQFASGDAEWARQKIRSYFDNTLTIAGIPIKIPFEGAYGKFWGDDSGGKI